ncbi:hypothetical protein [Sphingobacterium bovistauri]|uniref:Uncharacterized protein n=1 Tax=Sphingobacterium bovistauri TaxID=2781959 RepID=A0ABS7Z6Q7_9SPHI|nr:hypothetical protein [Sphingobacterium bovistauri]MCA5005247.1 hypothetical protein [Sphingobacterium bovistauri]
MKHTLVNPPEKERAKELWMQHGAGFLVFENIRKYALDKINPETDETTKAQIIKGINDTVYGLMMQMDGVFDPLENEQYRLELQSNIVLFKNEEVVEVINTLDGDGMCMAYHDWLEGDFGEDELINE